MSMKKTLIIILLLLIGSATIAQDTVRIKHTNYTTVFSKSLHYPIVVTWWETKQSDWCISKLPRKDQFQPDPLLKSETSLQKDYDAANKAHKAKNIKGFDRGHMSPANVSECSGPIVLTECFYFSNMAAQYHALNAGDWKSLEELTNNLAKQYDSVYVWAGSLGVAEKFGTTSVPKQCWKVIYIKKTKEYRAYLFDNVDGKQTGVPSHIVNINDIKKLTHFDFKLY